MRAVPIISVVFAITFYFSIISMVESRAASWKCNPCRTIAECEAEPEDFCVWGETRDGCGRRVCAKGPGQRCGGMHNILGKCGAGMWCQREDESRMETCHGCYDNSLECYQSIRY